MAKPTYIPTPITILITKYGKINAHLIPDLEYCAALIAGIEALIDKGEIKVEDYLVR